LFVEGDRRLIRHKNENASFLRLPRCENSIHGAAFFRFPSGGENMPARAQTLGIAELFGYSR